MSAATGLSMIEECVLDAIRRVGATSSSTYIKNQRFLDVMYAEHGIPPRAGFVALCDLARPYVSHLRLVDFHGNYGSRDFGPAAPRYTEARLTSLGDAASAAERGVGPALPIGLVNGDIHVDGTRPPLDPARVVHALCAAEFGATDAEVITALGPPPFPRAASSRVTWTASTPDSAPTYVSAAESRWSARPIRVAAGSCCASRNSRRKSARAR